MIINAIGKAQFGAIVTDIRLNRMDDDGFVAIKSAFLTYGFLVFPGQFLTDAENVDFGHRFGELEFAALPMRIRPRTRMAPTARSSVSKLNA